MDRKQQPSATRADNERPRSGADTPSDRRDARDPKRSDQGDDSRRQLDARSSAGDDRRSAPSSRPSGDRTGRGAARGATYGSYRDPGRPIPSSEDDLESTIAPDPEAQGQRYRMAHDIGRPPTPRPVSPGPDGPPELLHGRGRGGEQAGGAAAGLPEGVPQHVAPRQVAAAGYKPAATSSPAHGSAGRGRGAGSAPGEPLRRPNNPPPGRGAMPANADSREARPGTDDPVNTDVDARPDDIRRSRSTPPPSTSAREALLAELKSSGFGQSLRPTAARKDDAAGSIRTNLPAHQGAIPKRSAADQRSTIGRERSPGYDNPIQRGAHAEHVPARSDPSTAPGGAVAHVETRRSNLVADPSRHRDARDHNHAAHPERAAQAEDVEAFPDPSYRGPRDGSHATAPGAGAQLAPPVLHMYEPERGGALTASSVAQPLPEELRRGQREPPALAVHPLRDDNRPVHYGQGQRHGGDRRVRAADAQDPSFDIWTISSPDSEPPQGRSRAMHSTVHGDRRDRANRYLATDPAVLRSLQDVQMDPRVHGQRIPADDSVGPGVHENDRWLHQEVARWSARMHADRTLAVPAELQGAGAIGRFRPPAVVEQPGTSNITGELKKLGIGETASGPQVAHAPARQAQTGHCYQQAPLGRHNPRNDPHGPPRQRVHWWEADPVPATQLHAGQPGLDRSAHAQPQANVFVPHGHPRYPRGDHGDPHIAPGRPDRSRSGPYGQSTHARPAGESWSPGDTTAGTHAYTGAQRGAARGRHPRQGATHGGHDHVNSLWVDDPGQSFVDLMSTTVPKFYHGPSRGQPLSLEEEVLANQLTLLAREHARTENDLDQTLPHDYVGAAAISDDLRRLSSMRDALDNKRQTMRAARLATSTDATMPHPDPHAEEIPFRDLHAIFGGGYGTPEEAVTAIKEFFHYTPAPIGTIIRATTIALPSEARIYWYRLLRTYTAEHAFMTLGQTYTTGQTALQSAADLKSLSWDGSSDFKKLMIKWDLLYLETNRADPSAFHPTVREATRRQGIHSLLPASMHAKMHKAMARAQLQGRQWSSDDMIRYVVEQTRYAANPDDPAVIQANTTAVAVNNATMASRSRDAHHQSRARTETSEDRRSRMRSESRERRDRARSASLSRMRSPDNKPLPTVHAQPSTSPRSYNADKHALPGPSAFSWKQNNERSDRPRYDDGQRSQRFESRDRPQRYESRDRPHRYESRERHNSGQRNDSRSRFQSRERYDNRPRHNSRYNDYNRAHQYDTRSQSWDRRERHQSKSPNRHQQRGNSRDRGRTQYRDGDGRRWENRSPSYTTVRLPKSADGFTLRKRTPSPSGAARDYDVWRVQANSSVSVSPDAPTTTTPPDASRRWSGGWNRNRSRSYNRSGSNPR